MQVANVALQGKHVRLEPLELEHAEALWSIGDDESIWRYFPYWPHSLDEMAAILRTRLDAVAAGRELIWVQIETGGDQVVGSTSYLNIDVANRRVEIGATWITPAWQRTAINTEAKALLLTHAFETLDCVRVEFKTDARNLQSQRALERIGAQREGALRQHMVMPDGFLRDSVYYTVLPSEWPAVRARLTKRLARD